MPQKTFQRLDKDRQKEILDACLEEFILYDYSNASLTRIIQKLGLAKGSFYRYFASKLELYTYLIDYVKSFNLAFFTETLLGEGDDLIQAWIEYYLSVVRLDKTYPLYSCFAYKLTKDRHNIVLGNVSIRGKKIASQFFLPLIRKQQERGRIRKDIDAEYLAFTLVQIQSGIQDYLMVKYEIDFEKSVKNRTPLFSIPEETVKKELEAFAHILRSCFRMAEDGMGFR